MTIIKLYLSQKMKNNKIDKNNLNTEHEEILSENLETKVTVSFPDKIGIELVQANELRHYELFQWLVALVAPVAVGFWTAHVTNQTPGLWWSAVMFTALTALFLAIAVYYRRKVFHGSIVKSIFLKNFQ